MIIRCPHCKQFFNADIDHATEAGTIRCTHCRNDIPFGLRTVSENGATTIVAAPPAAEPSAPPTPACDTPAYGEPLSTPNPAAAETPARPAEPPEPAQPGLPDGEPQAAEQPAPAEPYQPYIPYGYASQPQPAYAPVYEPQQQPQPPRAQAAPKKPGNNGCMLATCLTLSALVVAVLALLGYFLYVGTHSTSSTADGYGADAFAADTAAVEEVVDSVVADDPTFLLGQPVDLGLSVRWASCNVGASSGHLGGWLCGWGAESAAVTSTDLDDYPSANPPASISGTGRDLAASMWGAGWRTPTVAEMDELVQQCAWEDDTEDGVQGCRATAPNGNSIFFPYNGYYVGTDHYRENRGAYVWSGSISDEDTRNAFCLKIEGDSVYLRADLRYKSFSIRPVCE